MLGLAETGISGNLPTTLGLLKKIKTIAIYTALLSGPIPKEIGNCTELTNLYLYQNSLTGSIPAELGQLTKLQTLLLWQNNLVGSIPEEIGNCRELSLVDFSLNLLTGSIPKSIGNLSKLQQLQLSTNQLTGIIPPEISNCTGLTDIELDNNAFSGEITIDFKRLENLTLFFAWQNKLTGKIPGDLAECRHLQSVDLSYNFLVGPIPEKIFGLLNLTKLLLLSNELSGFIPSEIGNCTNLFRLRLNGNRLSGVIPAEIGNLKNLNFLDMSNNRFVGLIPPAISGCDRLQFLDLHSNALSGALPEYFPKNLQFLDVSNNRLTGALTAGIGSLPELTKLLLGKNRLSGEIPRDISYCSKLQLLDLGDNGFSGEIPPELGQLPALEISLNLSCNQLSGEIPMQFSGLEKLGCLDISHNKLTGGLDALSGLQNLISLNISFNEFSGELPNTLFFQKLPMSDFAGNHGLYISDDGGGGSRSEFRSKRDAMPALKLAMSMLVSVSAVLLLTAVYMLVRIRTGADRSSEDEETWEVTLYQKLEFSITEVIKSLTSANVIGTGSSGVVYKVSIPNGETLAVKKMWASEDSGAFHNEISALGSIRHRNIVRLLGWAANRSTRLLFYNYLSNGSLSMFLHRAGKCAAEWETRYEIAIGVAHAVAYLHHDCVPAIIHGDVKSMNVLLGLKFEPFLADFGLARTFSSSSSSSSNSKPTHIAGSYGYIAPEHASTERITEKSDVYSFGVVLLEMITGRHPLDPALPGGAHLVQWVKHHLQRKYDALELIDARLRGQPDCQIQEMFQALAIAVLCVNSRAADRPAMKDVVALLKEIRLPVTDESK
ncbi:putative protein kinase RLK-Pelle-LRR-XI-1 family [Dioscorea sansibarensis]